MSGRPNPFEFRVPDSPPPLAPGPSALDLAGVVLRCFGLGVAVVVATPFLASAPQEWRGITIPVDVALILVAVGMTFRAGIRFNRAEQREHDAGYTTQYASWLKLWQLDPKSGEVLRRPGEPAIRRRRGGLRR